MKTTFVEGSIYQKVALTYFNPGSRQHCHRWLTNLGWKPEAFTPKGSPVMDEQVLKNCPIPEARLLSKYFDLSKQYGLLYKGENSIWNCLDHNEGIIRHRCISLEANTGRMIHAHPNIAQTPSKKEFRSLYIAPYDYSIVGADMDAQELRVLSHYLYPYDDGKYAEAVLNGKKEDKTDIHSINQKLTNLDSRDKAKTLIYAILYGASVIKIGYQITESPFTLDDMTEEERKQIETKLNRRSILIDGKKYYPISDSTYILVNEELIHRGVKGQRVYDLFLSRTSGYKQMKRDLSNQLKNYGYVKGLDGRRLHSRSEHSLVNLVCQSSAAIITKSWLVNTHRLFNEHQLKFGRDYHPLAVIHDEQQLAVRNHRILTVGELIVEAAKQVDKTLPLYVPMSASYKVGSSWAETH